MEVSGEMPVDACVSGRQGSDRIPEGTRRQQREIQGLHVGTERTMQSHWQFLQRTNHWEEDLAVFADDLKTLMDWKGHLRAAI